MSYKLIGRGRQTIEKPNIRWILRTENDNRSIVEMLRVNTGAKDFKKMKGIDQKDRKL